MLGLGLSVWPLNRGASDTHGPNIVVGGGTFDNSTGWTLEDGAVISGGVASFDNTGIACTATCTATDTITAGDYAWSFDLNAAPTGDSAQLVVGGSTAVTITAATQLGTKTGTVTSAAGNQTIAITANESTGMEIDNLSVRRVL